MNDDTQTRSAPAAQTLPARSREGAAAPFSSWRAFEGALAGVRGEATVVAGITVVAALLRFWSIGTVPLGLHGDEAWTGIDARRILDEGWIGVYVDSALGQPSGPLYWTALLFTFLPETTTTVRFSMAVFGVATIPLSYVAFRLMFDRTTATFAALVLTVLYWHLHLSRLGFMVISWPFMEMAVLASLWLAMRRRSLWLFALAGAITGLGVYSYNAYLVFVPVPFIALLWTYAPWRGRPLRPRDAGAAAVFAVAALVAASPFLDYVRENRDEYEAHQRVVGVQHSERWKEADALSAKADILWERFREWERGLVNGDRPDYGDGLAIQDQPVVDPTFALLALVGLVVAAWHWRRPAYATLLAAALLLPFGAVLTVGDGLFRRSLGLAPFVAVLAAIPLAWLWRRLARHPEPQRYAYLALVLLVPLFVGVRTTRDYFGPAQDSPPMRYVFPYQMDAASRYIAGLPEGTYVYFYSDRWPFGYETRRFIAPDAQGEDRSRTFGADTLVDDQPDLTTSRDRPVAFVFLDSYLPLADEVMQRYEEGSGTTARRGDEIMYRAWFVPGD
ncbi:MAG TPA: glycosyltransferase family 39 protein [Dehalococcoidia bacterium]|nr:glycosyltransferase family 39 protein [Dehalococcoidia bacterium]